MLIGVAFLPLPLGFVAWVGFVPLLVALEREVQAGASLRKLFALGFTFGIAFYLLGIHWIALLSEVAITVPWLKYPAWLCAAAYLALYAGLATALAGGLSRFARVPLAFVVPPVFLAIEELRASGELGFPWFQPGYTQHAYAPIVQMAALGSVSLVTLWVYVVNVLAMRAWTGRGRALATVAVLLAVLLPFAWGQRVLDAGPRPEGPRVALIQGNIPGEMKWSGKHQREILDRFLHLTEKAASDSSSAEPLALAIWPETATGTYLRKQMDQALEVVALAGRIGVPIASGFPDYDLGRDGRPRYFNGAGVFRPDGTTLPVYAKQHLVPFGERMPFQRWFPALGHLELGQAEWTPGDSRPLFDGGTGRFGFLICFESIFPDLAREDVLRGATWLVNVTNDEWFGNSAALYQHAAMSVFRSAENHVPLARCANTGLSFVTDANGRILERAPVWTPATVVARLTLPGTRTPYTRFGDWPGLASVIGVAGWSVMAMARALTRRSSAP